MKRYTGKRKYNSNVVFNQVVEPDDWEFAFKHPFSYQSIFAVKNEFPHSLRVKAYKYPPKPKKKDKGFKAKGALYTLLMILAMLVILLMVLQERITDAKAESADAQINKTKVAQLQGVNKENTALKDKLLSQMNTAKVDPRTKTIVKYYIAKYFGDEASYAEKVFTCESGLNPNADGVNKNGSHDRGVPQINDSNHKSFEKTTGLDYTTFAHDTEVSIKYAKWLRDNSRSGWSNWSCASIVDRRTS